MIRYRLCYEDDLTPVEWIDQPDMKVPLFASEAEAGRGSGEGPRSGISRFP